MTCNYLDNIWFVIDQEHRLNCSQVLLVKQSRTNLEQVGQHDECLLPDDGYIVPQTGRDVWDVVIHDVGVSDAQVAHDHHDVVAHGDLCADLELSGKHRQVLLRQFFVLQAQFTWKKTMVRSNDKQLDKMLRKRNGGRRSLPKVMTPWALTLVGRGFALYWDRGWDRGGDALSSSWYSV